MRTRRGMTLLEMVVALMITGMMAVIGASAFASLIDHRRVILDASAETERASALRDMLRTWIGSGSIQITTGGARARNTATSPTITNPLSQTATITAAASTGDELTFTTNALTPSMTPATRVRLFVDGDGSTPEVGLTIEYQTSNSAPLQRRQLDSTLLQMTVEFLDQRTNQWFPYSQAATVTPKAARITFPYVDGLQNPPRLLQLPMIFVMGQTATQTSTTGR